MGELDKGVPLHVPARPQRKEDVLAWAAKTNTVLMRLRSRAEPPLYQPNRVYCHPWQIVNAYDGSQYRIQVVWGSATALCRNADHVVISQELRTHYDSNEGDLLFDPFPITGTPGHLYLSASTTYGVWLRVGFVDASASSPHETEYTSIAVSSAKNQQMSVIASSTYTLLADSDTFATACGKAVFYLGRVQTFTGGNAEITQWRRSDIVLPFDSLPVGIIHPGS